MSKWYDIEKTGLPSPGTYLFKDEGAGEKARVIVRQNPNGSRSFLPYIDVTHWREFQPDEEKQYENI